MFNKVWSTTFMIALAIGIVLVLLFVTANAPLTSPFFGEFDLDWQMFRQSFLGG